MVATSPLKWYDTAIGALGAAAGAANHATNANPFGVRPYSYDTVAQSNPFGSSPFSYGSGSQGSIFGDRSQIGAISPLVNMQQQAMAHITSLLDQWQTQGTTGPGYQGGGNVGNVGQGIGQFDAGADADIARAAAMYGVPANFLKAIVARESSGDWNSNSHWVNSVRGGARIYGYVGVFEDAARSWGFDFDALNGNRLGQLEMLASGLRRFYDQSPNHDWAQAAAMHFSGNWNPSGYTDELGNNDAAYVNQVLDWWHQLDASAGNAGGYGSPSPLGNIASGLGGGRGLDSITGGQHYDISQEFGPTDWSMGAGAYMYGYGADYGVQGHPGLDIATPRGTQLSSPVGGTVTIAGGQPYYTFYGNGAPGVGELMITTDNGDQVILGHMMQITVQPGQRVQPGQFVGYSGGENGDHYHLEVRQRGGNTSSGYTAVDPRQYLGGVNVTSYGGGAQGYAQTPQQPQYGGGAFWFMAPLNQILGGYR